MILNIFISLFLAYLAGGVEDSQTYHLNSNLQWNGAMEMIDAIDWKGNVLDVGCGDGKITAWIAKKNRNGHVVGVDVSQSMIAFAKEHFPQDGHPNLEFSIADASELFYKEQFDIVVSLSTLHWVLDQEKALRGIWESLVPGGKTYIFTYAKAPMNLSKVAEDLILSEKWGSYFPGYKNERVYFTKEEYEKLLLKSGFSDVRIKTRPSETRYPDRQAFIGFAKPLLTYIRHLDPELKEAFLEEYTDKMIALAPPSGDGSITLQFLKLEAIAAKL